MQLHCVSHWNIYICTRIFYTNFIYATAGILCHSLYQIPHPPHPPQKKVTYILKVIMKRKGDNCKGVVCFILLHCHYVIIKNCNSLKSQNSIHKRSNWSKTNLLHCPTCFSLIVPPSGRTNHCSYKQSQ